LDCSKTKANWQKSRKKHWLYILVGTRKKKLNRYYREAACLRLNVYFMHNHRIDDSYIAVKLRWNKMNNLNFDSSLWLGGFGRKRIQVSLSPVSETELILKRPLCQRPLYNSLHMLRSTSGSIMTTATQHVYESEL